MRRHWLAVVLAVVACAAVPALATGAASRAAAKTPAALTASVVTARPVALMAHPASVTAVPKFVFHAGLAFGAFHHFIYLPFKAGKFTGGSLFSKIKNYGEAALAAVFIYHETKLALADAQQNKVLKVLVTPLTAAVSLFNTLVSEVKGHKLSTASVTSAASSVTSIEGLAKTAGSSITEAIPSVSQIAAGIAS